ncbi:hypothetical protein CYY_007189 [Polysphondylium violaceum]|uniref:Uncharacterized protein n=1 Tax=Polysphondylium violaceum TaxID=133409 RepID=A0A8J4PS81_9MYCE|nr:hypothetical protein CYY_007189 [Polysphondylium violaceum]
MYELLYIDLTSESKTDFWAYDSEYYDEIRYTPFIRETIHQSGDFANLNKQGFHLNISIDNNNNGIIKHILDVENLKLKLKIHAILNLSPSRESIVLVSQINNQLYYSCNTNTIPISGNILIGGKHFDASKCFGVMRFFRGITNSVKYIVWFTGNGRINGKPLGINIGQGLGNVDSLTENGVCVDGIIHKLGQVEIEKVSEFIWYLKNKRFGNEGKLMFTLLRKVEQENHFIKFTRVVGKFNGRFILDSGIEINILNLVGYMHISKND